MAFTLFMHHIDFVLYFFYANLQSALGFFFFFFLISYFVLLCVIVLILAPCLERLEQIGHPSFPLSLPLGVSYLGMTKAERFLRN